MRKYHFTTGVPKMEVDLFLEQFNNRLVDGGIVSIVRSTNNRGFDILYYYGDK